MDWQIISYVLGSLLLGVVAIWGATVFYAYKADQKYNDYRLNELATRLDKLQPK